MSLVVERLFPNGVPQTAVRGFAPPGVGWHWTAGGTGRAGWDGSVRHLIGTRTTVNASYHGGFWVEHAPNHVGCRTFIQWIVPLTSAAHSVNPSHCWKYNSNKSKSVQDARFAEVRRILGAKASDPNAGMIALSYAGMPADLERDLACGVFRQDLRDLAGQLVARPDVIARPHFGHGWIQPLTRYEMDVTTNFIGMLYGESASTPTTGGSEDMQFWRPVQEDWTAKVGAKFFDGAGNEKAFTASERVRSIAESSDGTYRLVKYGTNELLVMERAGLTPIAGTRVPAPGSYGFPPPEVVEKVIEVPTGITQETVEQAATAAVGGERTRIRKVLGI